MCSIVGSYKLDEFVSLINLNQSRGKHAWSLMLLYPGRDDGLTMTGGDGLFPVADCLADLADMDVPEGTYYIGHVQTPTTTDGNEYRHPAHVNPGGYLYHNGILHPSYCGTSGWDTEFLLQAMVDDMDLEYTLGEVRGAFSCLYVTPGKGALLFRNSSAPMYMKGTTISSVKFDGAHMTMSGTIFALSPTEWTPIGHFNEHYNTYKAEGNQ